MIAKMIAVLLLYSSLHAETCKLDTYAASWMATGTPFSCVAQSRKYTGVLVTQPARRFFKRGSLVLRFDEPLRVETKNSESIIRPGRGKQISSMLLAGGSGIGAKDLTDGLSGAVFKSWQMIPITFGVLALFEKGGDVLLKPGYPLEIGSVK